MGLTPKSSASVPNLNTPVLSIFTLKSLVRFRLIMKTVDYGIVTSS